MPQMAKEDRLDTAVVTSHHAPAALMNHRMVLDLAEQDHLVHAGAAAMRPFL
jgi:hypothetical protein